MALKKIVDLSRKIFGGMLAVLVLLLLVAGLYPVPRDAAVLPQDYGAGALSVDPSISGLQRAFPPINEMGNNPISPAKIELGRLLFFDAVLSQENDMSCATCHHPDLAFGDGRPQAMGAGGLGVGPGRTGGFQLARNTPTIWNAAYSTALFWDGRVENLEYQALVPISHIEEMAVANTNRLEDELKAIPEYVVLFNAAFGGAEDGVTIENVVNAIASFERSLLSSDSPFDRFAAGDRSALSPSQRRGLDLFRSAATRCFECHTPPTFSSDTFRVIGVPDAPGLEHDEGRAAVVASGEDGAFKVPTLRNSALSGPYMHNGVFSTLEEVIDFYAAGGGRAAGMANIDPFVQGFSLDEQQKEDLIAFLFALTDESQLPPIPAQVPSGLPVVPALENPARALVSQYNPLSSGESISEHSPATVTVQPGETIQEAVDRALPGDTIQIPFGTYHERVSIDYNDITLVGVPNEDGEWPTLDGEGTLSEGVIASGNGFEAAYLRVLNTTDTGILVEGVTGVYLHDLYVENAGTYGLYPVQSTQVLIERTEVIGSNDAGIYVGQCVDIIVRDNVVHGNVLGIEIENTVGSEVYDNYAYDNTVGIFIDLLPQLKSQVSLQTVVYDNLLDGNNHENFAKPDTAASLMPPGAGIGILAADQVEVYHNTIRNHKTAGVGIFHMSVGYDQAEINVGPTPEDIWIHDNLYENNGFDPDKFIRDMGIPGADVLWDISGANVRFDEQAAGFFPPIVPTKGWPSFFYNMYWHTLNLLIGLLGG